MHDGGLVLLGAGTLGGNLAEHLCRLGTPPACVIDRDRVERRNLSNQPYHQHQVGQLKARALSDLLHQMAGVRVVGTAREVTAENVDRLLRDFNLVVDALDNTRARTLVTEACSRLDIACLHVGLSADGYGEVSWNPTYRVPQQHGDPACHDPLSRSLALLVVAAASQAIRSFQETGRQRSFSLTEKDLVIVETTWPPMEVHPSANTR